MISENKEYLNASQRALLAIGLKSNFEKEARKRHSTNVGGVDPEIKDDFDKDMNIRSRDQSGKLFNVSGSLVTLAERVRAKGVPELETLVAEGNLSVSAASKVADLPHEEQTKLIGQGLEAIRQAAREVKQAKKPGKPGKTSPFDLAKRSLSRITDRNEIIELAAMLCSRLNEAGIMEAIDKMKELQKKSPTGNEVC